MRPGPGRAFIFLVMTTLGRLEVSADDSDARPAERGFPYFLFNRWTRRRAALLHARRGRRARGSRALSFDAIGRAPRPTARKKGGGARRVTLGGRNGPHDSSAAIFASRLVELLSRTDEDHRAKIPGQCGGERQPSRAGPSVRRSATSAAEQLAIAQSCDQRGNNPPTQRGLLSTLTSTPQPQNPQVHRRARKTPPSRPSRCDSLHTITRFAKKL